MELIHVRSVIAAYSISVHIRSMIRAQSLYMSAELIHVHSMSMIRA